MSRTRSRGSRLWQRWIWTLALVTSMACSESIRDHDETRAVSLIQLIATPGTYHEQRVTASGILSLDFEGTLLYLGEADRFQGLVMNSIWLGLEPEQIETYRSLEGGCVVLEGRFNAQRRGHLSLLAGTIEDILYIRRLPTVEELRQQQMPAE